MTCQWCQSAEENFQRAEDLVNNMGLSPEHPTVKRHMNRGAVALAFAARKHGPVMCSAKDEE